MAVMLAGRKRTFTLKVTVLFSLVLMKREKPLKVTGLSKPSVAPLKLKVLVWEGSWSVFVRLFALLAIRLLILLKRERLLAEPVFVPLRLIVIGVT